MPHDLHLRPERWPFGERMGSSQDCAGAELQVSEVSQSRTGFRDSVRIYASEQCPRQDSNLRSRLRRPLPGIALTCRNVLPEILSGARIGRDPPGRGCRVCRAGRLFIQPYASAHRYACPLIAQRSVTARAAPTHRAGRFARSPTPGHAELRTLPTRIFMRCWHVHSNFHGPR